MAAGDDSRWIHVGRCSRARCIHSDRFMLPFIRLHMRSLGHVDDLAFTGKDVCPQTQVVILVTSVVQQNVAVRMLRGIDVCFVHKARIVRVDLLGEMNELTAVVHILKQYDVLRIQTYCLHMSVFIEKSSAP